MKNYKGPWSFENNGDNILILTSNLGYVARIDLDHRPDGSTSELSSHYNNRMQNYAELITKAPELLSALRMLVERHQDHMLTEAEWALAEHLVKGLE